LIAQDRILSATILKVELIKDKGIGATARVVRVPLNKQKLEQEMSAALSVDEEEKKRQAGVGYTEVETKEDKEAKAKAGEEKKPLFSSAVGAAAYGATGEKKRPDEQDASALPQDPPLVLLNLLYAPEGSMMARLADFLVRIEDLSHILVWTKDNVRNPGDPCEITLIEFPRLQLSFFTKKDLDGKRRLYSSDHFGMFLSNNRDPMLLGLLDGIPHSLMLENLDGDLAILVPASLPRRLRDGAEPYPSDFLLVRNDRKWLENMKVRQHLYPIHLSLTFLFTPTLTSALYLVLLRFLNRQYSEVFRLADSCASDIKFSAEEEQLWAQLASVADDHSPDAHACKVGPVISCRAFPAVC
jgi:hypothetical protein